MTAAHTRPPLYRILLEPSEQWAGGRGSADLALAPSPFDMALTSDGHVLYDVTITVSGLPPAPAGTKYVAWLANGDLGEPRLIGTIGADGKVAGHVSYNKFVILVTQERDPLTDHWNGKVVLSGFSPSTYLENYAAKELFSGGVPNQ